MGLSIHYKGNLRTKAALPLLIEEVKDIVEIYKWPYHVFETDFPVNHFGRKKIKTNLYGISFTPPECETVSLTFLSNGTLIDYLSWVIYIKSQARDQSILQGGASVKTQYAGAAIHKLLIHIMDHLSKKYFRHFEMMDEGEYWETRDEKRLDKNFALLTSLLNGMQTIFLENPISEGEPFEKYFRRLIGKIHSLAEGHKNDDKQKLE